MNFIEFTSLVSALESVGKTSPNEDIINRVLNELIDYRLALVRLSSPEGLTKDEYSEAIKKARKLIK